MDLGLADRVYVLTGASRGLGYATAECLVAEGAKVVVSSRDPDKVAAAVDRLGGPDRAAGLAVDLADPDGPRRLVDEAVSRFGRLDGALVSVGGPPRGTALQATDDQWRAAFESVFLGALRTARAVVDRLTAGGALAFVLSSSARSPIEGLGISNGLRPGLLGVAKDMADELGPRGIRVVSLLPHRALVLPAPADPIPIIVGGRSNAAVRRAGRLGDGWLGIWNSARRFAEVVEIIADEAARAGRDDLPTRHAMQVWCGIADTKEHARARLAPAMQAFYQIPFESFEKYSPYGTAEDVAEFLVPYVEAGCTTFNLIPQADDPEAALAGAGAVKKLLART